MAGQRTQYSFNQCGEEARFSPGRDNPLAKGTAIRQGRREARDGRWQGAWPPYSDAVVMLGRLGARRARLSRRGDATAFREVGKGLDVVSRKIRIATLQPRIERLQPV